MIAEIGHFALILALVLSVVQCVLPLVGAARGIGSWMALARTAAYANALFLTISFGTLAYSFYISDFTLLNVASNSNSLLPWFYKVAASWGSHEGSILFWALMLTWWGFLVALTSRKLPQEKQRKAVAVLMNTEEGRAKFNQAVNTTTNILSPGDRELLGPTIKIWKNMLENTR